MYRAAERQWVAGRFGPQDRFRGVVRVCLDDHLEQLVVHPEPGGYPATAAAGADTEGTRRRPVAEGALRGIWGTGTEPAGGTAVRWPDPRSRPM